MHLTSVTVQLPLRFHPAFEELEDRLAPANLFYQFTGTTST